MRHITYIEICVGLGLGLGPVIGAFLYKQLSYEFTMYAFALINGIATLLCYVMLPNVLNKAAV